MGSKKYKLFILALLLILPWDMET